MNAITTNSESLLVAVAVSGPEWVKVVEFNTEVRSFEIMVWPRARRCMT